MDERRHNMDGALFVDEEERGRERDGRERSARPRASQNDGKAEAARRVTQGILDRMELETSVLVREDDEQVVLDIDGPDAGRAIGKKGMTLEALQFLVNKIVNREPDERRHIVLDSGDYRERHDNGLVSMAKREAKRAVSSGRAVTLEPMSARDRRVIHVSLAKFPGVSTRSEGEGMERRLQIIPVRGERARDERGERSERTREERPSRQPEARGERARDERPQRARDERSERMRDERPSRQPEERGERPRDDRSERPRDERPRDERPRDERPRDERPSRQPEERAHDERFERARDDRAARAPDERRPRTREGAARDERPAGRDERPRGVARDERSRPAPRLERHENESTRERELARGDERERGDELARERSHERPHDYEREAPSYRSDAGERDDRERSYAEGRAERSDDLGYPGRSERELRPAERRDFDAGERVDRGRRR